MEEEEIPSLPKPAGAEKGKLGFVDLVQKSLNNGAPADPMFFSDVINQFKKDGDPVDLNFGEETKKKIREKFGDDGLKEWETLYDNTLQLNKGMEGKDFYEPMVNRSLNNMARGYTRFKSGADESNDKQGEFAPGYSYPIKIRSDEDIADHAPSIIDYDPARGYFERQINGPKDIDSIVSMGGENKRLTIATNGDMAKINPEIAELVGNQSLEKDAPYKDSKGLYRYRSLQPGEQPTSNIRSVWGPESYYHSSYMSEMVQSLNDFAMDSLDAAQYLGALPTNLILNGTQRGARMMGLDANWADPWNETQNNYRNWSQSRRSARSFEDQHGTFSNFTNFSKAMTNLVAQIAVTRGMGLLGGAAGQGLKGLGMSLSDDAIRGMMSNSAMGYGMMYAASAANEQARQVGLSPIEGDVMGVIAGGVIHLTEKMTGGQFTDKVFGPIKSKVYANKIVTEINDQLGKLGINPSALAKDEKAYMSLVSNVARKTHAWLGETASTRGQNMVQGFVGEAVQESSEDGLNMLAQEFRDYITGEDKYGNTWDEAFSQLGESFVLGGFGGAIGGGMFYDKRHWEMSHVDESKYDWITSAVLKGEGGNVRSTLERMYREGKLGSTMFSAMQNESATLKSLSKDPVAISQNELLHKQYKAQLDLIEGFVKKYENTAFQSKAELGDFINGVTQGREFISDDNFASVERNTAHAMQKEAIALEIRRNQANSQLALRIAKSMGKAELDDIEQVHAFNGRIVSIKRSGQSNPEVPNTVTRNVLEEAVRQIENGTDTYSDLMKVHGDYYDAHVVLDDSVYLLSKNPSNPDYIAAHQEAQAEYEKAEKAYQTAQEQAKMPDDTLEILNALRDYKNVDADLKSDKRTEFYGHKAILEIAKTQFPGDFKSRGNMTVHDFRQKNKDREYFNSTIETENQANQELLVQFDQLATEAANLEGQALELKLGEISKLSETTGKLFLSPQTRALLEAKTKAMEASNMPVIALANLTMGLAAGEVLSEAKIASVIRKLLSLREAVGEDGRINPEFEGILGIVGESVSEELANGTPQDQWADETKWAEFMDGMRDHMAGADLDQLVKELEAALPQIDRVIKSLWDSKSGVEGFNPDELFEFSHWLESSDFTDFLANRSVKEMMKSVSKASLPLDYLDMMAGDAAFVFSAAKLDFSGFDSDDKQMLARAFNGNRINMDNAGSSLLKKYGELVGEATDENTSGDFTRLEEAESMRREVRDNLVETLLENAINEWGAENGHEKANTLIRGLRLMDANLDYIIDLAKSNLNKRAGRDYKIKQGYVNFGATALLELNKTLGFLSPEEEKEVSELIVRPAAEATNDKMKSETDARLEKLVNIEEMASTSLRSVLGEEGKAQEILDNLGLTKDALFEQNNQGRVSRSAFRNFHEDSNNPYDPDSESNQLEQKFNYLVQLERGSVRTFFNRFNEIISKEKAESQNMPSFEQALSARQFFGFLMSEESSHLKTAVTAWLGENNRMTDSMIFVRGIAGAGKSTFVTNLAIELYSNEMKRLGKSAAMVYSAPNAAQLKNIGDTIDRISSEDLSAKAIEIAELMGSRQKLDLAKLGDARLILVDEATLLDSNFQSFLNDVEKHNQTASPEAQVKVVLVGDEFQNGASSTISDGAISFYDNYTVPVIERTVPLTSPYRTGKVESYALQMVHRKIIVEMTKIQRAFQYRGSGEIYTRWDGKKTKVDQSNVSDLVNEMFAHFNSTKQFTYHEKSPGVISYGARVVSSRDDVLEVFSKNLADGISNGTADDVILIVQNEDLIGKTVLDVLKLTVGSGLTLSADQLRTYVKSSQNVQGLSKKHVFVDIDLAMPLASDRIEKASEGMVADVKNAMQALYVAESREVESVMLHLPGFHANVKVVNRDAVLSYSKVEFNKPDESESEKTKRLELVAENSNLVELVSRLARPEETSPEAEGGTEIDSGIGKAGLSNWTVPPADAGKTKKPEKTAMTPDDNTRENHESNKNGNALQEFLDNFDKYNEEVEEEMRNGKTIEDVYREIEEEGDGSCNL